MLLKLNQSVFRNAGAIAFITVGSLLFSCSGNDSAENKQAENTQVTEKKATGKDACSLITEEEAKAVIGGPVKKAVGTESMCQYIDDSEELSKSANVSIQLEYGAGASYDSYITSTERNFGIKAKPVAGIGDKAFFAVGQLIVLKGPNFMMVAVGKDGTEEEILAAEKSVALKAIERLGN
jgi:hypothetical protein